MLSSRFLKPKQDTNSSNDISERYSDNGNLSLKSGVLPSSVISRLDRSSSGSSHGSGSGSGTNSSGYQSEVSEVRTIQERCQVELEDSDPEDQSQVVTVTGGLRVGPGAGQGAFTSQVKTEKLTSTGRDLKTKMPADTLGNSISTFLNKTDQISQKYRSAQIENEMTEDRLGRATSVARATSVSRQFEPSSSSFVRAGSVARGYESASRDPFYSQINRQAVGGMRAQASFLSPNNSILEQVQSQNSFVSPPQSKYAVREPKPQNNGKFRSLEDECNWILSGRDPLPDNIEEEDENTLDDISGDELSEMTLDNDDGPAPTGSEESPSGERRPPAVKPRKKERKRSEIRDLTSQMSTLNSAYTSVAQRYPTNIYNNTYRNGDEDDGVYRMKYERTMNELDDAKRKLVNQHEEDLEQMMTMKKQMEKKLNEAYEEVDDQKRDSAQWKNKYKKAQSEMDETRICLEEQNEKNELLERKFRKVDSELIEIQQEILREANIRGMLEKDMETLRQEKSKLTDEIHTLRLDVEQKESKIKSLLRELEELRSDTSNEEEARKLKRQKADLENRLREQAEEIDELSGQVQVLESAKANLERSIQQMKAEHQRQLEMKEEELEDVKAGFGKKLKVLEQQLEQEHEDRIGFLREKHELEGRIVNLQDMLEASAEQESIVAKLKKDLKRAKALLKDAHCVAENTQTEGTSNIIMRQLKQQLEEAEYNRAAAVKAKQSKELELTDLQSQLDDMARNRKLAEDRSNKLTREKSELTVQLQENEDELSEVIRKYKSSVSTISNDQITIQNQTSQIQELELESKKLKEQLADISRRLEEMDRNKGKEGKEEATAADIQKLEIKCKELETKLDLEKTTKGRMESHISRQTDVIESLQKDLEDLAVKEKKGQDEQKKMAASIRSIREELASVQTKETEANHKKSEVEKQLEVADSEKNSLKQQLKLAQTRIESLQKALKGEDSDEEEEMSSFLDHHRRAMSVTRDRARSMTRELSVGREMRGTSLSRDIRATSMSRDLRGSSMTRDTLTREPLAMPRDSRDIRSMSRDIRASVAKEFEAATRDFLSTRAEDTKDVTNVASTSNVATPNVAKETPFESIAEVE